MIATLTAIGFATTTVVALAGWWSATQRIVFLDAVIEAAKTEIWAEDAR